MSDIRIKQVSVWTDYTRVVLDTQGHVWESKRDWDCSDGGLFLLKGWFPWKKVEIE